MISKYGDNAFKFIKHLMVGDRVVIPNIFDICEQMPKYREKYLSQYREHLNPETKKGTVDENTQIMQGMALGGEFLGYNTETQEYAIYTAENKYIKELKGRGLNLGLTVGKNLEGIIHCVRLDKEYLPGKSTLCCHTKPVALNVKTNVTTDKFVITPLWVLSTMRCVLEELLEVNKVLKITQSMPNNVIKSRYVSTHKEVIKEYSDKFLVKVPKAKYYEGVLLAYLPTLGAPSTSIGLTRVDIVRLEKIEKINDFRDLDVAPCNPDPLNSLLQNELLGSYLETTFSRNLDAEGNEITTPEKEQAQKEILSVFNKYGANVTVDSGVFNLLQKSHEINVSGVLEIWKVIPAEWHRYLQKAKKVITELQPVDLSDSYVSLQHLLATHVVMISYVTKNAKFRRVIVTNNEQLLETLYGKTYRIHYESDGVKGSKAVEILRTTDDLELVKQQTGIELEDKDVADFITSVQEYEKARREKFKGSSEYVTARKLFQPKGSRQYYQQIPVKRIHSITLLSSKN